MKYHSRILSSIGILTLVCICLPCSAKGNVPISELLWARELLYSAVSPCRWQLGPYFHDPLDVYTKFLQKFRPTPEIYMGFAQACELDCLYDKAEQSARIAFRLAPTKSYRSQYTRIRLAARIYRKISCYLTSSRRIIRLMHSPYADEWIVITAKKSVPFQFVEPELRYVTLNIYKVNGNGFVKRYSYCTIGGPNHYVSRVGLFVLDMNGDGKVEILVHCVFYGASVEPSTLFVFSWHYNRPYQIIKACSEEIPVQVLDFDRDGLYEIKTVFGVGRDMSHAEQPFWMDLYAYRKHAYRPANRLYQYNYKVLQKDFAQSLAKYPHDWQILQYMGRISEIIGDSNAALIYYKKSTLEVESVIKKYNVYGGLDVEEKGLQFNKNRIAALTRESVPDN